MMHRAVNNFANELNAISDTIKQRTVQIRAALQKKAFDEAGIQVQSINTSQSQQQPSSKIMMQTSRVRICRGDPERAERRRERG